MSSFFVLEEGLKELAHKLCYCDGIGVDPNDAAHENTISAKMIVNKALDFMLIFRSDGFHHLQLLLDVTLAVSGWQRHQGPTDEVEDGDGHNSDIPEPYQKEDHLIEEIDGENALNCISHIVAKHTNDEVTHRDPGEPRRVTPFCSVADLPEDVDAIEVEVLPKEEVHEEQLAHQVGNVENLADQKADGEIIARFATTAACSAEQGGDTQSAVSSVVLATWYESETHNKIPLKQEVNLTRRYNALAFLGVAFNIVSTA